MDWVRNDDKLKFLIETERIWVVYGGKMLFCYQVSKKRARPFCHPVCTLKGSILTLDAPHDHLHHNGFYMAHGDVNNCNFWVDPDLPEPPSYQPKQRGRIIHERFEQIFCDLDCAGFAAHSIWLNHEGQPILRETRWVKVWKPTDLSKWWMDWSFCWEAHEKEVLFGTGSPYHGLSFRTTHFLDGGKAINSDGKEGIEQCDGAFARWCAYTNLLEDKNEHASVVMMDHPDNPCHPTPFFCMNHPFGFLSAAFSRHKPFTIPKGKTVTFTYRLLIQQGELDIEFVESLFQQFKRGI